MVDLERIASKITDGYNASEETAFTRDFVLPERNEVVNILTDLRELFFPAYYATDRREQDGKAFAKEVLSSVYNRLKKQVELSLSFRHKRSAEKEAEKITDAFVSTLPKIQSSLLTDLQATFDGDPAAKCKEEIVFSYPGFYAVFVYRIAHILYEFDVPFIPRMMSEHAHGKTGIDINPGAKIGEYFFIDHGTGIVIGETAIIGNRVKLYQGVTLGALSPRKGQSLAGKKRHPTVEDGVTVYSGASILGGETVIGEEAVIGGNTFVLESVKKGAKVSAKIPELIIKHKE